MLSGSFFHNAETVLRDSAQNIVDQFLSVPPRGQWHPNGFAVFNFGDLEGLGRMRFHVWPRGLRVALAGQPAIHSHPWDLCSLIIAGCYRDTVYQVREFDIDGPGRLQKFELRFGSADEGDQVRPTPVWYEVTVAEERTVAAGNFHHLRAGVLHESQIPFKSLVATLLITSKAIDPSKLLLVGNGSFGVRNYVRPEISAEEFGRIKADLLACL